MGLPKSGDAASRFSTYVEGLASVIGHADRAKPLRDYCVGLPCERKSVEPMAPAEALGRTLKAPLARNSPRHGRSVEAHSATRPPR
jgi:SRSO17 transposase